MKVTYISHSGFSVELPSATLLFDYYKGQLPNFPCDKPLFVFSSHSHGDHFVPQVFDLAKRYPQIHYIFSHDIWMMRKKHTRAGVPEECFTSATYLRAHETKTFSLAQSDPYDTNNVATPEKAQLTVSTLRSTDMGVAFLVECDGLKIYHAGDLHWWAWPGDTKQNNNNMTANYQREIAVLDKLLTDPSHPSTKTPVDAPLLDLAFLPLDGRLEENYTLGMEYFLQKIQVHHVFPMHFWDKYDVISNFLEKYNSNQGQYDSPFPHTVYSIDREGQSWTL